MMVSMRLGGLLWSPYIHKAPSSTRLLSSSAALLSPKSELATLRKKTGYSISICKKALDENANDLAIAEKWLAEQAQAQGWAKAAKLQGRNTSQGLMGLKIVDNVAAMVELNCETDFVARNEKFSTLLEQISNECIKVAGGELKTALDGGAVAALPAGEGGTLADLVALNIGQLGENLALGRATVLRAAPGVAVSGLCHPSTGASADSAALQSGRYAVLLAYTAARPDPLEGGRTAASVTRGLCQHIIGMAPTAIRDEEDTDNSLVHQTFILDEEVKVGELLESAGIEIVDFIRAEVGKGSE